MSFPDRALTKAKKAESDESPEKFVWDVHKYTNDYIRFADTKAAFVAASATALMGALVSSTLFDHCFARPLRNLSALQWAGFVGLGFLAASLVLAVSVVSPRLTRHKAGVGFIFWESVAEYENHRRFSKALGTSTAIERTTAASDHLFMLATIAKSKYHRARSAIYVGMVGGVVTGVVLFIRHTL